jgi:hypothetical protein
VSIATLPARMMINAMAEAKMGRVMEKFTRTLPTWATLAAYTLPSRPQASKPSEVARR